MWLESYRKLTDLGEGRTKLTYRLSFEVGPGGLIGRTYAAFLETLYQSRLPKYLQLLKQQVEEI